jgi:hypothetical protein
MFFPGGPSDLGESKDKKDNPLNPVDSSRAGLGKALDSKATKDGSTSTPPPPVSIGKQGDSKSMGGSTPLMMGSPEEKARENKPTLAPTAPPPPAPAKTPGNDSYFIPDSSAGSGADSKAGSGTGGRSVAAPPGPLPYPEMPESVTPAAPTSGTERVRPITSGAAPTPPQPITRPQPQVIVYDEQEYRATAGDTFDTISKRYYGTEKFAEALRRHNRHHARASVQMTNDGTLAPGERLYIPPADILEQRYGDTISKSSSPSQTVPASFPAPSAPASAPPPGQPSGWGGPQGK